jgi:integrase
MATLKAVVLKHQLREDGTYNVKIRVTHDRRSAYIPTEHYISARQVSADCKKIKDQFILQQLDITLARLRKEISALGPKVSLYTARTLAEHLAEVIRPGSDSIDFLEYAQKKAEDLKSVGRTSVASSYVGVIHNLKRFLGRDKLEFKEITVKFLENYETYLRTRTGEGIRPLQSRGIECNLASIRALFNLARREYNDEDLDDVRIKNNPFARYRVPRSEEPEKRSLPVEMILKIKEYVRKEKSKYGRRGKELRSEVARDVYLLSFYLVGMNSKDIFCLDRIDGDRITYNRAKTKDRRADKAEISIKIEPEARELIEKYKDPTGKRAFCFYLHHKNESTFNASLNRGLKEIGEVIGVENLEFYSARHSWATIARNQCGISKDDIALCLNHTDTTKMVTDKYIKKDFSRIDRANEQVLRFFRGMDPAAEHITTSEDQPRRRDTVLPGDKV